jgi:hypothetical protein
MVHLIVTYDVLEVSTVTGQDHTDALLFPVCVGRSALSVYRWLEGHPNIAVETSMDIHPAALWHALPNTQVSPTTIMLWRQRAHLLVKEPGALPARVAKFCEAR